MRHAQVSTTMNVYGNALMASKREANTAVVNKILRSHNDEGNDLATAPENPTEKC